MHEADPNDPLTAVIQASLTAADPEFRQRHAAFAAKELRWREYRRLLRNVPAALRRWWR